MMHTQIHPTHVLSIPGHHICTVRAWYQLGRHLECTIPPPIAPLEFPNWHPLRRPPDHAFFPQLPQAVDNWEFPESCPFNTGQCRSSWQLHRRDRALEHPGLCPLGLCPAIQNHKAHAVHRGDSPTQAEPSRLGEVALPPNL